MIIKSLTENAGALYILKFFSPFPLPSERYWLERECLNQYIKLQRVHHYSPCALYCFTAKGETPRKHTIMLENKNSAIQLC